MAAGEGAATRSLAHATWFRQLSLAAERDTRLVAVTLVERLREALQNVPPDQEPHVSTHELRPGGAPSATAMAHSPRHAACLTQLYSLPRLQEAQPRIPCELILTQYQVSEKEKEKGMRFSLRKGKSEETGGRLV